MDSNGIFAVLLLLAGIGILIAEVFIPSGGLLGVITFLTLIVSVIFAYRAWGTTNPNIFWSFCVALLILVPSALATAFYILPKTAMGKKILLEGPDADTLTPFAGETHHRQSLVGRFGQSISPLSPGGMVLVNGERMHAISDGMIIEAGQSVEVIEVRGTRVVVRPGVQPTASPESEKPSEPSSRLDFEIPQG